MKNVKRAILGCAIGILFFGLSSCDGCTDKLKEQDEKVTFEEVEDIIITEDRARTISKNYREHRGRIIEVYENNGRDLYDSTEKEKKSEKEETQEGRNEQQNVEKGFVPVQYTYYDFKKLKKYLKYIEQETKKAGADISTMRIYFANYPENERDRDKQRRNTVLFVPTINIDGNESAYYISDEGKDGVERPFLLTDSLQRTSKPAPEHSLDLSKKAEEANFFPNVASSPFFADKSVIGNEGGRNPPANH